MPTTSFFDLPVELRQQVYDHLLPPDGLATYDSTSYWEHEATRAAARKAHPRLDAELGGWVGKHCGGLRIVITATGDLPPARIRMDRLARIEIYIDHYDIKNPEEGVLALWQKLRDLAAGLQHYPYLRSVSVRFAEECDGCTGDEHWCSAIDQADYPGPSCGSLLKLERPSCGSLLKMEEPNATSIIGHLLAPLRDLPRCNEAFVWPLDGLAWDNDALEKLGIVRTEHDAAGMCSLFRATERWLEGDRMGKFARSVKRMTPMEVFEHRRYMKQQNAKWHRRCDRVRNSVGFVDRIP